MENQITATTQISSNDLAVAFAKELKEYLSADQLAQVNDRNKQYDETTCATHDFCDANHFMLAAWEKLTGSEFNFFESDSDEKLLDEAWTIARQNDFFVMAEKLTQAIAILKKKVCSGLNPTFGDTPIEQINFDFVTPAHKILITLIDDPELNIEVPITEVKFR